MNYEDRELSRRPSSAKDMSQVCLVSAVTRRLIRNLTLHFTDLIIIILR